MSKCLINSSIFLLIYLFSTIFCSSLSLNYVKCLFINQIQSNEEIISFEFSTNSRLYSSSTVYNSVKMKYLGDSNKDVFLSCSINYNTYTTTSSYYTYKYHIPCYLDYTSQLNGGNYCVQIVDELVDSFSSVNYCSDGNTITAIKDMNKATATITGFATE